MAIHLLLTPGGGLEEGQPDSPPGMMTAVDKRLGRRYAELFFLFGEDWGLIP
jgi:hypothetical protein